jgi:hypothetical protein
LSNVGKGVMEGVGRGVGEGVVHVAVLCMCLAT